MSEVKHNGCHDCGSLKQEILKSVTASRTAKNRNTQKPATTTGSIALCDSCFMKEMENRKGGK